MAFPTTGVLDDFQRADEGPPPSANWSTPTGVGGLKVISNVCAADVSAGSLGIWNPTTFGPDSECHATVSTKPVGSGNVVAVYARLVQAGAITTFDGYVVFATVAAGTDTIVAQRVDNGVGTTLGAAASQEFAAGDGLGIEVVGTTIAIYYRSGAGSYTSLGTRTDSAYSAAGNIGALLSSSTGRIDDFGGGKVVPNLTLSGTFTPAGTLIKQVSKSAVGSITPTGLLAKLTGKSASGSIEPDGTLIAAHLALLALAGVIEPIGALVKQVGKATAGALTPSGALIKSVRLSMAGVIEPTGAILRQFQRILSGAIEPTGALVKQARTALNGALEPIGALVKETRKAFSGSITPEAILDAIKQSGTYFVELAGSLPFAGALVKQIQANRDGALTPTGDLVKQTAKTFAGALTPTGALTTLRTIYAAFTGAITPSGSLAKQTSKLLSGAITPAGSLSRQIRKILSGALTLAGTLLAEIVDEEADTRGLLTLSDSLIHAVLLSDAAVYRVLISDAKRFSVNVSDSQP